MNKDERIAELEKSVQMLDEQHDFYKFQVDETMKHLEEIEDMLPYPHCVQNFQHHIKWLVEQIKGQRRDSP